MLSNAEKYLFKSSIKDLGSIVSDNLVKPEKSANITLAELKNFGSTVPLSFNSSETFVGKIFSAIDRIDIFPKLVAH